MKKTKLYSFQKCQIEYGLYLFLILVNLLILSTSCFAQAVHEEWFVCQSDNDCIKTYGCADVAVNKKYLEPFQSTVVCSAAAPPNPDAVAQCVDNKCVIVIPETKKN